MDVLVTGANGTVGTALRDHLAPDENRYDVTWLDVVDHPDHETVLADTTDDEAVREAIDGTDAVVHLAMSDFLGGPDSRSLEWTDGFAADCEEICTVLDAAREADVQTVVYASSNHAVGMYEVEHAPAIYEPGYGLTVDHAAPPRPDSPYGVVKVFGEAMGRLAAEAHGLRFFALRICSVRDPEYDHPYGDAERGVENGEFERGSDAYEEQVARQQCMWLSRRDLAQLVDRCLRLGRGSDGAGRGADRFDARAGAFDVFYGRSASDRGWLDLEHARDVLGYEPLDDASEWESPPGR